MAKIEKLTFTVMSMPEWRDGQPGCMGCKNELKVRETVYMDSVSRIWCLGCGEKKGAPKLKRCSQCKTKKPDVKFRIDPYEWDVVGKKVYRNLCDVCESQIADEI